MAVATDVRLKVRSLPALRYLDVVLVLVAMAPALALGAPVLGYAIGAGGWIVQRVIGEADRRWMRKVADAAQAARRTSLFEGFARIWLLAGFIIIAALVGGREDGLTAALVIFGAYSVAFAVKVISGPPPPDSCPMSVLARMSRRRKITYGILLVYLGGLIVLGIVFGIHDTPEQLVQHRLAVPPGDLGAPGRPARHQQGSPLPADDRGAHDRHPLVRRQAHADAAESGADRRRVDATT